MEYPKLKLTPKQIHIIHGALSRHLKKHHYEIVEDVAHIKDELRRYEIQLQESNITEQVLKKEEAKKQAEESKKKAEEAKTKAEEAKTKAEEAKTKAEEAKTKAEEAKTKAEEAKKKGPEFIPLKSEKKVDDPKGVSDGPPNKTAEKKASAS